MGVRVVSGELRPQAPSAGKRRVDARGAVHDVAVREDEAVRREHESRAVAPRPAGGGAPAGPATARGTGPKSNPPEPSPTPNSYRRISLPQKQQRTRRC